MTVLEFRKPEKQLPPSGGGEPHVLSVHTYANGDTRTTIIEQPDHAEVDLAFAAEDLFRNHIWAQHELFQNSKNLDDDLLLVVRIYCSSLVSSTWPPSGTNGIEPTDDAFETPAQLRWLRNRLDDAYWHTDKRRGIGYKVHAFKNWLFRQTNALKEKFK
jgi:hypothetical protein